MNDAPREEGWFEDDIWDADRVRTRADTRVRLAGHRGYSVAAVHDETGEMAALTQVFVDPAEPAWGHQGLTAVTRPHRGHRLGLLTKAAMLEWLATAEPRLERIDDHQRRGQLAHDRGERGTRLSSSPSRATSSSPCR